MSKFQVISKIVQAIYIIFSILLLVAASYSNKIILLILFRIRDRKSAVSALSPHTSPQKFVLDLQVLGVLGLPEKNEFFGSSYRKNPRFVLGLCEIDLFNNDLLQKNYSIWFCWFWILEMAVFGVIQNCFVLFKLDYKESSNRRLFVDI